MVLKSYAPCTFSEDVIAELARGASIAQDGLAVPPPCFPAPSANVIGPGRF